MKNRLRAAAMAAMLLLTVGGARPATADAATGGVVFSMSNASGSNSVLAWSRAANGSLSFAGATPTGGRGTGRPLNNQGALALAGEWLYVVNPGSDSLTVFRVNGTTLTRTDVERSRGDRPISVTVDGTLVYVLNGGGNGNIRGFRRDAAGRLTYIRGSGRKLSANRVKPVQIAFNPAGDRLVVAERRTDRLTHYDVGGDGTTSAPRVQPSAGAEPFGFDFAPNGTLVVSEAGDHVNDGSSASSYRFNGPALATISAAVPTTETAACWTAVTPDGRYAYVTNTPDHSISGFAIAASGALTMLDADGRTAATGAGSFPIDLDTSAGGDFLYVLAAGTHRILVYEIRGDGALGARPGVGGLSRAANGLVAR